MNTTRQELLEKKRLSGIIRTWAGKNKKVFWKYDVSCFYKTYKIRVVNLPAPSTENILVSSNSRLLNNQQKTQLCNAIKNAYPRVELLGNACIDVQIDYANGSVIAHVV